jgi:hypothetical protein
MIDNFCISMGYSERSGCPSAHSIICWRMAFAAERIWRGREEVNGHYTELAAAIIVADHGCAPIWADGPRPRRPPTPVLAPGLPAQTFRPCLWSGWPFLGLALARSTIEFGKPPINDAATCCKSSRAVYLVHDQNDTMRSVFFITASG